MAPDDMTRTSLTCAADVRYNERNDEGREADAHVSRSP